MYMFQDTRAFGVAGEGSRLATVSVDEEFEQVRAEADSIRQARRATELLEAYRLLSEELAQLRKAAVIRAHDELGMSYTDVAAAAGISKGRVTQIRKSSP